MARGKVQMRKVENPVHRQVTFCKRRTGLFKKARELSVLCDADIGIMVFSSHGKLFELSTKGTMQDLIEMYNKMYQEVQSDGTQVNQPQDIEISTLKQEINLLQKGLRYMLGEGLTGPLALDELHALERHLNTWMQHIRTTKMHVMFQEIQSLKNKEGGLKAADEFLQEKVVEKAVVFGVAPLTIEQSGVLNASPVAIEHDGLFSVASMISDIQYPLTIQNDYSDFRSSASGCCSYW